MLNLPEEGGDLIASCDAFGIGLVSVLMKKVKVNAYASRRLNTHEKELPYSQYGVGSCGPCSYIWRHYLCNVHCEIFTDHRSLHLQLERFKLEVA